MNKKQKKEPFSLKNMNVCPTTMRAPVRWTI